MEPKSPSPGWLGRVFLILVFGVLGSSCGTFRYNRAWSNYEAPSTQASVFEGRWRGTWLSEDNGHKGGLRCIVTPEESGYRAWFRATYGIFSFQYKALYTLIEQSANHVRFEGEEDLGALFGGLYQYEGEIRGDEFHARYQAANGDHGVFEMVRVLDGE